MDKLQTQKEKREQFNKIIKLVRKDPEKGLKLFYEKYAKIIQITAQTICHSEYLANEVVNNVLIKVWKNAKKIKNIKNPEGWIYIVTANAAKDAMRSRYNLPLDAQIVSNVDFTQDIIEEQSFYYLIKDLSETEQEIIICKFVLNDTFQDIADMMHKPLATITSIYYRALSKIKNDFQEKKEKIE